MDGAAPSAPAAENVDGAAGNDNQAAAPPLIQPIAPSAVRRLVAGQAVTDLGSAVKELVDNAIDADAGRVCVKLHDHGLEAIEVSDNGTGVPPSSRPLMAMKHATSKLRRFDDLYQDVSRSDFAASNGSFDGPGFGSNAGSHMACAPTLGFRGEALFCLANISRSLTVSTRTSDDDDHGGLGEQFAFDDQGELMPHLTKRMPRPTGTTVTVRGLFESLPVRRADLRKRIKAQSMKMVKMMQGYALLCLNSQFTLSSLGKDKSKSKGKGKGRTKSQVLFATSESSNTLEARTASVMGVKFLSGLTRIDIDLSGALPLTEDARETSKDRNEFVKGRCKVEGLVSHAPTASAGPATARDLQFFGVNGRPVDLPSVSRALGDAWRMFDPAAEAKCSGTIGNAGSSSLGRKRPACVLSFTLPNDTYDVNLSPDKREVMFTEEAAMMDLIREGLMDLWSQQSEGVFMSNEAESRTNDSKREGVGNEGDSKNDLRSDKKNPNTKGNEKKSGIHISGVVDGPVATSLHSEKRPDRPANALVSPPEDSVNDDAALEIQVNQNEGAQDEVEFTRRKSSSHQLRQAGGHSDVPRLARQHQDQKRWEQMLLNFERVDKRQLQKDLSCMLSENSGSSPDEQKRSGVEETSKRQSCKELLAKTHHADKAGRNIVRTKRAEDFRQPSRKKRQKQDVASFLENFAFGGTVDRGNHCDSTSDEDESEVHSSRSKRNTKMDVGRASVLADKSLGSSLGNGTESEKANNRNHLVVTNSSSIGDSEYAEQEKVRLSPSPPEQEKVRLSPSPPVEAVWNSFSGTQDVIAQFQSARLTMKKNRKSLLSSVERQRSKITGSNSQSSSNDVPIVNKESTVKIRKEDFLEMSIIGQFNLGFILARCRDHNLWIFDQHACDEKYNFERLMKETVIHEQKLIAPLPLELSPSEEHCILENMEMFEHNGFRFAYNPDKEPRHRLALTALPHSGSGGDGTKPVQFGKDDVGALCAMLGADGTSSTEGYIAGFDTGREGGRIAGVNAVRRYAGLKGCGSTQNGSSIVRLPKAVAMFASRACRKSIMIGTALSEKEQVNILKKLHKTDVPWNCAHGRPTISHIRCMAESLVADDNAVAAHVAGSSLSVIGDE